MHLHLQKPTLAAGQAWSAVRRASRGRTVNALRHAWCAALATALAAPALGAEAGAVEFEGGFLHDMGQDVDLSRFARAGAILPGDYDIDLTINDKERIRQHVRVQSGPKGEAARFCFQAGDIERWGVRVDQLPDPQAAAALLKRECVRVEEVVPGAHFEMDAASLGGSLSIPQAYAGRVKRGYVDPKEWQRGINAGILGYRANLFRSDYRGPGQEQSNTDFSVSLNAGVNMGRWRLRDNGTYENSTQSGSHYNTQNTYLRTDVDRFDAKFTAGQYFTPGGDFESIPFTGAQLASDDRMLPESERGYAPVVRGIAQTNAKVSIRQNGNLVYETTVAPGPFAIDDLYATSYAGDLDVTITESDGRTRSFTVPYGAAVEMLRPGSSRFSVSAGRYRDETLDRAPAFMRGSYRRGISNNVTLYGGALVGQGYASALAGAALSTPVGAFGLDATVARANAVAGQPDSRAMSGRSVRASYSKSLASTGTDFGLAAYRFSSADYLSFNDYARIYGGRGSEVRRERNRLQLSVSQPLGDWGSVYASGIAHDYWDGQERGATFQVGYSKSFDWGSLNIAASREMQQDKPVNTLMATVSIPLGHASSRPLLSATASHDSDGNTSLQTRLGGTLGEDHALSYGVYANASQGDAAGSNHGFGGSASYRTAKSQLGASYSQGGDYRQASVSASGTVLAHSGGLTFSPDQGETMALVSAPGAKGAKLTNGQGVRLDGDGEALTAGLTPYERNRIGIDPRDLPQDVALKSAWQETVPRSGAVVRLDYGTEVGQPLLLSIADDEIPFGANVVDDDGQSVAAVGQGGLVFLRGDHANLHVVWGAGKGQRCDLHYPPPPAAPADGSYARVQATCVPGALSAGHTTTKAENEG